MEMRLLGKTGLSTAPIVFRGNVFGWTVDEKTSFKFRSVVPVPDRHPLI